MHRPRLKAVFAPISAGHRTISLGFPRTPGSATIQDPTGGIRAVLALLDGRHSTADVAHELKHRVNRADIEAVVASLTAAGFIEDAARVPPPELTPRELRRYSRNTEFYSYFSDRDSEAGPVDRYAPQITLKNSSVVVLGVGGLGSHVALHLTALGVGRLHLVDNDVVDESNLNRQSLFTDDDIGRPKVQVAARRLSQVNPLVRLSTSSSPVESIDDAARLIVRSDLLICAADRPRVDLDRWINEACMAERRPWMRGASVGLTAVLDLFVPGRTDCVECRLQPDSETGLAAPDVFVRELRALDDHLVSPCISPVSGLLGALTAFETLKFLTGMTPTPLLDSQLVIDLPRTEIHYLPTRPRESCPVCSQVQLQQKQDHEPATAIA